MAEHQPEQGVAQALDLIFAGEEPTTTRSHRAADACVEPASDDAPSTQRSRPGAFALPGVLAKLARPWAIDAIDADCEHLPDGLPADAGEVVAKAFNESFYLHHLLPTLRAGIFAAAAAAVLLLLEAVLPRGAGSVVFGMVLGACLVAFLPLGEMLADQAWRRPEFLPYLEAEVFKPTVSLSTVGSLLLLGLPLMLGFTVGLGWLTVLIVPCAFLSMVWLMAGRLSPILDGFPLLCPLSRKETGALLLAALLLAFGCGAVALGVLLGPFFRLIGLVAALWTWTFAVRVSGLLARRLWVRVQASLHLDV